MRRSERFQVPLDLAPTDQVAVLLRAAEQISGRKPTQIVRELCGAFLPRWIEAEKAKQEVLMGTSQIESVRREDVDEARHTDERSLRRATAAYDEEAYVHGRERLDPKDPFSAFAARGSRRVIPLSRSRRTA